jgi:intracellular septation protein A
MPAPTRLAATVAWRLLEAVVLPLVLFYSLLVTVGMIWALIGAVAWAYLTVGVKLVRGGGPSMLLLATAGMATVQAGLTLAADSATVYFLQPTVATYLFAAALLVTVPLDRPLIQRLAHDFCPLPPEVVRSAALRRFFQRVSLLWAAVLFVNASLTLSLLLTAPITWSVPVANAASVPPVLIGLCMSVTWFRGSLRDGGFDLRWGTPTRTGAVEAALS